MFFFKITSNTKRILFLLMLINLSFSCSIKKQIKQTSKNKTTQEIHSLALNKINISFVSEDETIQAKGFLRLNEDAILISIQAFLGVEIARIHINKENIIILSRLKKEYLIFTYEELGHLGFNLTFHDLSALIKNQLFDTENKNIKTDELLKNAKYNELFNGYEIIVNGEEFKLGFFLDKEKNIKKTNIINLKETNTIMFDYINHTLINEIEYPSIIKISFFDQKKQYSIELKSNNILINQDIFTEFSIPEKYTKNENKQSIF